MNKKFNNLKDEELLKKVEELIDGKIDRQRFADSFLGFCSRLIGVKPKPDADFQLSLKRSLLEKYHEREVESRDSLVLKIINIRRFITMKNVKWFVPAGAVVAIALLVAVGISFKGTTPVSAQEIAKKSYQTIVNLPADQQAKVSATLGMDSRTILQEAQNAKDLKALTYDEFASQGQLPPDPDGKLHTLKFLQFTREDGQNVILGIDQNDNLPKFMSSSYENPNPPEGDSGEKGFNTSFRNDKGLVNCTIENGVEKCTEVTE
jgi:hypothetical protein